MWPDVRADRWVYHQDRFPVDHRHSSNLSHLPNNRLNDKPFHWRLLIRCYFLVMELQVNNDKIWRWTNERKIKLVGKTLRGKFWMTKKNLFGCFRSCEFFYKRIVWPDFCVFSLSPFQIHRFIHVFYRCKQTNKLLTKYFYYICKLIPTSIQRTWKMSVQTKIKIPNQLLIR